VSGSTPSASEVLPLLSIFNCAKTFGETKALKSVDLEIYPGEVHALIGQNGSGKSTLIKILAGYHEPDPGATLKARGEILPLPLTPARATRLGLAFLHQDVGMAPSLSIVENLLVNRYHTGRFGRLRWKYERARVRDLLAQFGLHLDPELPVRLLTRGEQALLGIIRAWSILEERGGGVMVLDEPTASLPEADVDRLFEVLRGVRHRRSSALIVSHRLDEVTAIADRISILRDGKLVASVATEGAEHQSLVDLMLGREALIRYHGGNRTRRIEETVLTVDMLSGRLLKGATFSVRKGEILGVTGLTGMGQDELPYLLCGANRRTTGEIQISGVRLDDQKPAEAFHAGLATLPQDRQRQGGFLTATAAENITASTISKYFHHGWMDRRREESAAMQSMEHYRVVPEQPKRRFQAFSGGNQQKALLARLMQTQPKVIVLHEPTQGVDIASRQHILAAIARSAEEGTGVILVSIEHNDLAQLCDRVLIVSRGRIVAELAGDEISELAIARSCHLGSDAQTRDHAASEPQEDSLI